MASPSKCEKTGFLPRGPFYAAVDYSCSSELLILSIKAEGYETKENAFRFSNK